MEINLKTWVSGIIYFKFLKIFLFSFLLGNTGGYDDYNINYPETNPTMSTNYDDFTNNYGGGGGGKYHIILSLMIILYIMYMI